MSKMTGLDYKIKEMAGRIRELREIEGFSSGEMAEKTGKGFGTGTTGNTEHVRESPDRRKG